jgi:DNA topoisomerase-2
MAPWYKGWQGEMEPNGVCKYDCWGVHDVREEEGACDITELPVGKWTRDYKNFLEELATNGDIDELREHHQENRVHFELQGDMAALEKKAEGAGGLGKFLRLKGSICSTNLVLFDHDGAIYKYKAVEDIMKAWYDLRLALYDRRKAWQLKKLLKELKTLENKARFIRAVIEEEVKLKRVKRRDIVVQLTAMKFLKQSQLDAILGQKRSTTLVVSQPEASMESGEDGEEEEAPGVTPAREYDYLLSMPLWALSEERVAELNRARD